MILLKIILNSALREEKIPKNLILVNSLSV